MFTLALIQISADTSQATRKLTVLPEGDQSISQSVGINTAAEVEQIIWQTTDQAFSYETNGSIDAIKNVVLNVKKPGPAEYLGFGEQGGKTVLKKPTYLNYFCKTSPGRKLTLC
jgi:hypothetical protein